MSAIEFSISDVLGRAWELTKKHGLILALFFLVVSMVGSGTSQAVMFPFFTESWIVDPALQPTPEEALRWLGSYMAIVPMLLVIQLALQVGLLNMYLLTVRGGRPEISAFKLPVRTYIYFVLISLCIIIIVYLGILCCIIPGIWLAVRLSYAQLWVLDHPNCTVGEALKGSWRMTQGHFWNLFGLSVCAYLITCLGLLACCIGVYFTGTIAGFAYIIAYELLKPVCKDGDSSAASRGVSPEVVPPVSPASSSAETQVQAPEEGMEGSVSSRTESAPVGNLCEGDDSASSATVTESDEPLVFRPVTPAPEGLCDVVLSDAGSDPEAVIRLIMGSVYGKGEKEVRTLLDTLPAVLMEKVSPLQAERLKQTLEEAGARIDIR